MKDIIVPLGQHCQMEMLPQNKVVRVHVDITALKVLTKQNLAREEHMDHYQNERDCRIVSIALEENFVQNSVKLLPMVAVLQGFIVVDVH